MGGADSKEKQVIDPREFTQIPVKAANIQRYGEIKAYKHNSEDFKKGMQSTIYQNEENFLKMEEVCKQVMLLEHDSIIRLFETHSKRTEEFCSTFWQLILYFEYIDSDLRQEFETRVSQQISYHESELWHILVSAIAALAYLKINKYEHNDIRPYSILVSDEGKVKLLLKGVLGKGFNCYEEILCARPDNGIYLSPEQLLALSNKEISPDTPASKIDVYNLGLTVLECALMRHLPELIDLQNYQVNQPMIESCLEEVRQIYGDNLHNFLSEMLTYEEIERPDVEQLFAKIELLCEAGIQVADRLFQPKENTNIAPSQQDENEDQIDDQNLIRSLDNNNNENQLIQQQNQQFSQNQNQQQQQQQQLYALPQSNQEEAEFYSQQINQYNQQFPDLHEQEEKPKRTQHFKSDKQQPIIQGLPDSNGIDPRLVDAEVLEKNGKVNEYAASSDIEEILEEYRQKNRQKQIEIEKHLQSSRELVPLNQNTTTTINQQQQQQQFLKIQQQQQQQNTQQEKIIVPQQQYNIQQLQQQQQQIMIQQPQQQQIPVQQQPQQQQQQDVIMVKSAKKHHSTQSNGQQQQQPQRGIKTIQLEPQQQQQPQQKKQQQQQQLLQQPAIQVIPQQQQFVQKEVILTPQRNTYQKVYQQQFQVLPQQQPQQQVNIQQQQQQPQSQTVLQPQSQIIYETIPQTTFIQQSSQQQQLPSSQQQIISYENLPQIQHQHQHQHATSTTHQHIKMSPQIQNSSTKEYIRSQAPPGFVRKENMPTNAKIIQPPPNAMLYSSTQAYEAPYSQQIKI